MDVAKEYGMTCGVPAKTIIREFNPLETEANNNPSDADDIVSGKAITGQLHSSSDKDYFAIVAEGAGIISVNFETSYNSGNAYYTVSLVDSDGKVLASQKTGQDTEFSAGISNAATYYVVVSGATYYTGEEYKTHRSDDCNQHSQGQKPKLTTIPLLRMILYLAKQLQASCTPALTKITSQ